MSLLPNLDELDDEQKMAVLESVQKSIAQSKEIQKRKIGENVDLVVQALKKIEEDIRSRYDDIGNAIEKRVASIKDGRDGINGRDGKDGKDGKQGKDGRPGRDGKDGKNGLNGVDGQDGVSVVNAHIDFDGSLIISLSSGKEINVGEVVAPALAEQIKVITNGGGTAQSVLDTLTSLQSQIDAIGEAVVYKGLWNASTNSPTITSGVGTSGNFYIVSVAGSTNLDGITNWKEGDWAVFNGVAWQRVEGGADGNFTTVTASSLTSGRVTYAGAGGLLQDSSNLTFNGTTLTSAGFSGPLNGTVGATTPSTGAFTTLSATGGITSTLNGVSFNASTGSTGTNAIVQVTNGTQTGRLAVAADNSVYVGTTSNTSFNVLVNGSPTSTFSTTGLAVTGTLSATGAISGTGADNNIVLSQNGSTQWRINNSNAGTAAAANLLLQNGTAVAGVYLFGTGYTTNGVLKANSASLYNNNSAGVSIAADNASGVITFASGGLTERARITSSGVFYLGPQATNFSFTNGSAVDLSGSGTGLSGNGTNLTLGVWNGPIVFQAGNSGGALVERARIDSSGNVGIGTSSPGAKLHVEGSVDASVISQTVNTSTGTSAFAQTTVVGNDTTLRLIAYGSNHVARGNTAWLNVNEASRSLVLATGNTERMRIDSSGNVGIGTSSPGVRLEVSGATAGSGFSALRIGNTDTTASSPVAMIFLSADDGTARNRATLASGSDGTNNGYLSFSTRLSGSITERMRIDSSGNVGIGTSSPNDKLTVASDNYLSFQTSSTTFNSGRVARIGGVSVGSGNGYLVFETYQGGSGGGERMRIDSSGNVGIGGSPSTATRTTVQNCGSPVGYWVSSGVMQLQANAVYNSGDKFVGTGYALYYAQDPSSGAHVWSTSSASGTAGNAVTYTERARITSGGDFSITQAPGKYTVDVTGGATSIANNGTVDFSNASGLLVVNNYTAGGVGLWLCGGGAATLVSTVPSGYGSLAYNAGIDGYRWTNNSGGTAVFGFFFVRTRPNA